MLGFVGLGESEFPHVAGQTFTEPMITYEQLENPVFYQHCVSPKEGYPSRELRLEFPDLEKRLPTLWTRSKFVSSCGVVTLSAIKDYIENPKNA